MAVRGDGFCLLNAIDLLLYCDFDEVVTVDNMANSVLEHLATNIDYYKQFHTGDLLWDSKGYFKFGNYCDSVMDIIIVATPKSTTPESVNLSERARWKYTDNRANHRCKGQRSLFEIYIGPPESRSQPL